MKKFIQLFQPLFNRIRMIFWEYRIQVYYSFIVLFIFALLLKFEITLPEDLYVKNTSAAVEILSVISTILATILGIVLAILIFSIELSSKTYLSYGIKLLFENRSLKIFVTKFVLGLIISIVSLFLIDENTKVSSTTGNLVTFCFLYFIFCLLSIILPAKNIILSSISKKTIKELVEKINIDEFWPTTVRNRSNNYEKPDYVKYYEDIESHPLYVLRDITIKNIKNGNIYIPLIICDELFANLKAKLKDLNHNKLYIRDAINIYNSVLIGILYTAIREKKEGIIYNYIKNYRDLHKFGSNYKYQWSEFIELDSDFQEIIQITIKNNLTESARFGFNAIVSILLYNLKNNIPEEKDLKNLQQRYGQIDKWEKSESTLRIHWDRTVNSPLWMLSSFVQDISDIKSTSLVYSHHYAIRNLLFELREIKQIGELQRSYVIEKTIDIFFSSALNFAKHKLPVNYVLDPMDSDVLFFTDENSIYYRKYVLILYRNFIWDLMNINIYERTIISNVTITIHMYLQKVGSDNFYIEAIIYLLEFANQIRKRLKNKNTIESKTIYLSLYKSITRMLEEMEKENIESHLIKEKITTISKKFKNIEKINKNINATKTNWPDILHKAD